MNSIVFPGIPLVNLIIWLCIICMLGITSGYIVNKILKSFSVAFVSILQAAKGRDPVYKRRMYQQILKQEESVSYVLGKTPTLLLIIVVTAISETAIVIFSKNYFHPFEHYLILISAFTITLRLPLLIESFVRESINAYESSMRPFGEPYYKWRARPVLFGSAIAPFLAVIFI